MYTSGPVANPDRSGPPQPSATQRVYDHVKTRILAATYAGGDLLTEGRLGDLTGVSRTPVREALLRLEAEGLVRLYPKKGALVVPVTAEEAADIVEARTLVETWSAPRAWAARKGLADDLAPLVDAMRGHRDRADVVAFSEADRSFHEQIVAAAGNAVLTRLYRGLRERQLCINVAVIRVSAERMDAAIADHADLVALLRGDDEQAFLDLTESHLRRAVSQLESAGASAR
ncbi:MAG TPA: GntR family transcriptional regulator [Nocardioidaceae bacterium]|nr:GntR family transcriptional regulator [Nocardioidaceae bacterium]